MMAKKKPLTSPEQPIETRIETVIAFVLGVKPEQIKDESHFIDDLKADSLDCVELLIAMETEFKMDIHDDDAEAVKTVGELKTYITNVLKQQAA